MNLLQLDAVGKRYRLGAVAALDGVTLAVTQGEFVAVLGPSGCGKSTLLRIIAGIETPDCGTVSYDGRDITAMPPEKRGFGMVFQNYALFPNLTARENIGYGLRGPQWPREKRNEREEEMLLLAGLQDRAHQYPEELSGGQQQRVALARALAPRPRLLLLDEPLSALDAQVRLTLGQEIRRMQRATGVAAILVTHDQQEALSLSDRIILMKQGRVMQAGSPEELYTEPCCRFGSEFIGHMNVLPPELFRPLRSSAALQGESAPQGEEAEAPLMGVRYEDVEVSLPSEQLLRKPGAYVGKVEHSALMGPYYRLEILLNDFATRLFADIPRTADAAVIRQGSLVAVVLPSERLYPLREGAAD